MRRAGRVVAEMHERIREAIRPGVTTARARPDRPRGARAPRRTSNFLGYHGFPAVICASPNDVVVHGIPGDDACSSEGDIVSIDCGAIVDGWHGDAAFTAPVGAVGREAERADRGRRRSASLAGHRRDGRRRPARRHRRTPCRRSCRGRRVPVVREYTGHGIGTGHARGARRSPTTAGPARGPKLRPATCSPSSRWSAPARPRPTCSTTAGASSPPTAPGRPRRAHRRHHRRRPRDPDPPVTGWERL